MLVGLEQSKEGGTLCAIGISHLAEKTQAYPGRILVNMMLVKCMVYPIGSLKLTN